MDGLRIVTWTNCELQIGRIAGSWRSVASTAARPARPHADAITLQPPTLMLDRGRLERVELGGSRAACGAGALGSDAFRLHSRRTIADELGSLGQGQRLDLGEVASCLLSAPAPLDGVRLGGARPLVPEDTAARSGALVRAEAGPPCPL